MKSDFGNDLEVEIWLLGVAVYGSHLESILGLAIQQYRRRPALEDLTRIYLSSITGVQGLFTEQSYAPAEEYSNVDMVVLTNLYHRHKSVEQKDKLSSHWWFGESFSLLYQNPKTTKPQEMAHAFAKTLRYFNDEVAQHRLEGDAPDWIKERLAIQHYVGDVLMVTSKYLFQPGQKRKLPPQGEGTSTED